MKNEHLLETSGLTKVFPARTGSFTSKQYLKAVDGVQLNLKTGETLGLAGESGCGKSTVAKLIQGLIPPTAGTIRYCGTDLDSLDKTGRMSFHRGVQMIFQDPFASLNPRMRIGEIIGEPLLIHGIASGNEKRRRVVLLMEKVGLAEKHYNRYPHEFSGGQRQRIGIARALAVTPRLVIADEPVSALDLSIQAQILNLLLELKDEFSLSYLFITHDLSVIRHMSDRIAIMYLGKIVETGNRDTIFSSFMHPYTEALLSAVPQPRPGKQQKRILLQGDIPSPLAIPSGCTFHTRCPYSQAICLTEVPVLEEKEPGHQAACHFSSQLFRK